MTRPNASLEDSNNRRFVTKPARQPKPRFAVTLRLTLGPRAQITRLHTQHLAGEDRYSADAQAQTTPEPLDHPFFRHAVPYPHAQHPVDMLYERKVVALDHVLLELFAVVQRYLLGVLQQTRVREAELALESRCASDW